MKLGANTTLSLEIPDDTTVGTELMVDAVIRLVVTEVSADVIDVTSFGWHRSDGPSTVLGMVRAVAVGHAVNVTDHVADDGNTQVPRATLERS